jgi:hypothetical protein
MTYQSAMFNSAKSTRNFIIQNIEAFVWIAAILYFAISPVHLENHFTICPLNLVGIEHCPGCGLGRSMILLLHGQFIESFRTHPLSSFALGILIFRSVVVLNKNLMRSKQLKNNETLNM